MASTTMFDTIDALVALIEGLPQVTGSGGNVIVADGFPSGLASNVVVSVGGTPNPTVTFTSQTVTMGDGQVDEVYEVEGTVKVKEGSIDQKAARDSAKTVFEAIEAAVRAAFQAGGNRLGVSGLQFAEVFAGDLKQSDGTDNLTERLVSLTFRVRCTGFI